MAGTKMTLRRYGNESLYWEEQEIIVDQNYIDTNGLFVRLAYPYTMNSKMLEVYLNGQRLSDGGGFEEVSDTLIRLDLGTYPQGHPQAGQTVKLAVGDEIFIKVWKAEYAQTGGSIDAARFARLEEEVVNARKFGDDDQAYTSLDDRLDAIQAQSNVRIPLLVLNKVRPGLSDYMLPIPFSGRVDALRAVLGTPGAEDTLIQIEKCSQAGIEGTPVWEAMLADPIVIEAGSLSATPVLLGQVQILTGDHLRLSIEQAGAGAKGLTVQLLVST